LSGPNRGGQRLFRVDEFDLGLARADARAATDSLDRRKDNIHIEKAEADDTSLRPAGTQAMADRLLDILWK
jgi:hypothetical protein